MSIRQIVVNVFSNWANLLVSILVAFFVSPIIVHSLGNEMYGVWTLIVSLTGYFTVLDFGVNTAIVRYVSSRSAQGDQAGARAIFSTAIAIFSGVMLLVALGGGIFAFFFQEFFALHAIPRGYLIAVFLISVCDLAFGLFFSVYLGSLAAVQEFRFLNGTSIAINIIKSLVLIVLLRQGAGLLTLALCQLAASLVKAFWQSRRLHRRYGYLHFSRESVEKATVKLIYSYSIYSFLIAVALKVLFYTDSIVIGKMLTMAAVTYYAIPSTLLAYLEKFVWALTAVLVPVISGNEATGQQTDNKRLYGLGTRYALLVSAPVIIALYFTGQDFIILWMGQEIGSHSASVLKILLLGYGVAFSQLIAHGILKGISRHRVLAYILVTEALVNLGLSLALVRPYGIEGVAVGTALPLILASLATAAFTCHVLKMRLLRYLWWAYAGPLVGVVVTAWAASLWVQPSTSYLEVFGQSALIWLLFMGCALPLCVEREHRALLLSKLSLSLKVVK